MIRFATIALAVLLLSSTADAQTFKVVRREDRSRVDVELDGRLFTSYRWDERIGRPVLFPIMSAGGNYLTRGFPIETRDNETINHPHQVGSSLVYGDVNGIDFWNTSAFRTPKELERMGRIVLKEIVSSKNGKGIGELVTRSDWVHPKGKLMLLETTRFTFYAKGSVRWIDRDTTLIAVNEDVVFGDNKEGFFALHLNVQLQQDDQFPVKITSAAGVISERTVKDGLSGRYFTSEGLQGNSLWGTSAEWAAVTGRIGTEDVTIAVFDSPGNPNFPARMMVRPYGLLALNPFGQRAFDAGNAQRKLTLKAGRSIAFRYRLFISPGNADAATIEKAYQAFSANNN